MTSPRSYSARPLAVLACLLAAAWCLLLAAGCQNGPGAGGLPALSNSLKNLESPFAKRDAKKKGPSERDPKFDEKMVEAQNLERADKSDEARRIYEQLIVKYPKRHEAYHRLGVVADRQQRYREAQALYSQAIRLHPKDPELFNDLGYNFYLQGKLDKAEAALIKSASLAPSVGRYRNNLGLVLGHQGRHGEALEQFRHAGSEAEANYNLAFVLAAQENVPGAKDCFLRALAADATYEPARRALSAFDRYEEDPQGFMDNGPVVQNGVRLVPYVEGGIENPQAQPASYNTPTISDRTNPGLRRDVQGLMKQTRSLMSQRTSGQREGQQVWRGEPSADSGGTFQPGP